MDFNTTLRNDEKSVYNMRALYEQYGYKQFRMSKFEEYDLYVKNKDFLVSDNIITFTGAGGKLMALKPDVTFSIIKNTTDDPKGITKLYYNENVYRAVDGNDFKEIMQTGLECIGDVDTYNICEVIMLAKESLKLTGEDFLIDISHMGFVSALLEYLEIDGNERDTVIKCIGEKNTHEIYSILGEKAAMIADMINAYGDFDTVITALEKINVNDKTNTVIDELKQIKSILEETDCFDKIHLDFSVTSDLNYYNGIVLQGYIKGVPSIVLSGGQYDKLMNKMGRKSRAIGFAVYHDVLKQLNTEGEKYDADVVITYTGDTNPIALAKKVRELTGSGMSVFVCKQIPDNFKYKLHIKEGEQ